MTSAKVMFLDIQIPDDDPLRPAKLVVNTAAPGFRIYDKDDHVDWESDFIWLALINEEDGLDFKLRQTVDGQREIQAFWKEQELDDTAKIQTYLQHDELWDVYQLRAVVLLQDRVDAQLQTILDFGNPEHSAGIREGPWNLAERLRSLELDMLQRARAKFEDEVSVSPYSTDSLAAAVIQRIGILLILMFVNRKQLCSIPQPCNAILAL